MNTDLASGSSLVKSIIEKLKGIQKCDVLFCPPFPFLVPIHELIKDTRFSLGGQNLHWEDSGAFTGEISAEMLLSTGCKYVIIGHSERRKYFNETDETVNLRVKKALHAGLIPIVCIGETIDERKADQTKHVIRKQLQNGLKGFSKEKLSTTILAYEPVWAIGTGQTATPEQAVEVHKYIRQLLKQWYDNQFAQHVRIQYGGSVNDTNANDLLGQPDIDGALVGGASLKADQFAKIVEAGELYS
jgi:triosephosphate isomerase